MLPSSHNYACHFLPAMNGQSTTGREGRESDPGYTDSRSSIRGLPKMTSLRGGGRVEIFLKNDDGMMTVGEGGLAAKPPKEIPQGEGGGVEAQKSDK